MSSDRAFVVPEPAEVLEVLEADSPAVMLMIIEYIVPDLPLCKRQAKP